MWATAGELNQALPTVISAIWRVKDTANEGGWVRQNTTVVGWYLLVWWWLRLFLQCDGWRKFKKCVVDRVETFGAWCTQFCLTHSIWCLFIPGRVILQPSRAFCVFDFYSGGIRFESRLQHLLYRWDSFVAFVSTPTKIWDNTLN
jgi:hypothetical protein